MDRADSTDNTVFLRGTLNAEPELRTLADGDQVWSFRLAVRRPGTDRKVTDTIDCAARTASVSRTVQNWTIGDPVEVSGALHRRFWRGATGVASRYEVDVTSAKRASRRPVRT